MSGLTGTQAASVLLLALAGVIIYSNTFEAPFHFDDMANIVENPVVRNPAYFLSPSRAKGLPLFDTFRSRYVGYLSFALNYGVHGLRVAGYHAVNLALHVLSAALVYLLVALSFRTPVLEDSPLRKRSHAAALAAAALFLTHPVQTQSVTYIVQRFASLAAFFSLASLALYIRWRLDGRPKSFYVLSLLAALCAMKTKETAFTLPLAVALYEGLFFTGPWRRRLLFLGPFVLSMLVIPLTLLGGERPLGEILGGVGEAVRPEGGMSRLDYLATQFRVVVTYLRLIVLPMNQNLDYDYPVSSSFPSTGVLLSFLLLLALFCSGLFLLVRSRGGKGVLRLGGFGMVWFFLALLVESSVVPIPDMAFEHRVYLPLAGMAILGAAGMMYLAESLGPAARRAVLGMFVVIVAVFSLLTYERNRVWQSGFHLWEDVVAKSPYKARGYNNLGNRYTEEQEYGKAVEYYGYALLINPGHQEYWFNRGTAYLHMGDYDKAIEHFEETLRRMPGMAEAHNNLCHAYYRKDLLDKAEESCLRALRLNPDLREARGNLNNILRRRAEGG